MLLWVYSESGKFDNQVAEDIVRAFLYGIAPAKIHGVMTKEEREEELKNKKVMQLESFKPPELKKQSK